jgi:hypothetical protein
MSPPEFTLNPTAPLLFPEEFIATLAEPVAPVDPVG